LLKDTILTIQTAVKQLADVNFALDEALIVAITDVRGDIIFANKKFCEISKYTLQELIGQNHRIVSSNYHPVEYYREMYRTIAHGKVWRGEFKNRAKDGSIYWMDSTIVPLMNEQGKPYRYVSFRIDITERKKTEEWIRRADKVAAVEQLASAIAHEIRNPLAAIQWSVQALESRTNEDNERIRLITTELERIDSIVEQFLLLAKPHTVSFQNSDITGVLGIAVSLMRIQARKKNIKILTEFENDIPIVCCDQNQLEQVFINILKNAIEAMPDGGHISVQLKKDDLQGVVIRFIDEGVGIPEELISNIGDPFYTTKKKGTGLGLMVSEKIIRAHQGNLSISSELNKGTVVEIILPSSESLEPLS
jgi:PAS domain S-box-containing protein